MVKVGYEYNPKLRSQLYFWPQNATKITDRGGYKYDIKTKNPDHNHAESIL
jgi:hypothetical protein